MNNNLAKILIPQLLIWAFALNLLIPIHSQSYFFSLAVGQTHISQGWFLDKNIFTELGLNSAWASVSPLYDVVIFLLEKYFGDQGPAFLNIFIFLLLSYFVFLSSRLVSILSVNDLTNDVSENSLELEKNINYIDSRLGSLCMWAMLATGSMLFGSGLDPRLFFFVGVTYLIVIGLKINEQSKLKKIVFLIPFFLFLLFDLRIILSPIIAIIVLYIGRVILNKAQIFFYFYLQILLILIGMLVPFIRDGFFTYIRSLFVEVTLLQQLYPELRTIRLVFESSYEGYFFPSFSLGFFILLLALYFLRFLDEKRAPFFFSLFLFFILLLGSCISSTIRGLVALGFMLNLSISLSSRLSMGRIFKIEEVFLIISRGFSRLSFTGRVFVLFAYSLVQIMGFIKYPVTDLLMPARAVDEALNSGKCPKLSPLSSGGYLVYRFQHTSKCKPYFTIFTLGALNQNEISALIK